MEKEELIFKIKSKKELSGISSIIVNEALDKYLKKNKIDIVKISKFDVKTIIKEIRSELRLLTGRFEDKYIADYNLTDEKDIKRLLASHRSTLERLEDYKILDKLISNLKPKSILDLGCGINPLALAKPGIKYYASDIKESDLALVEFYFKIKNISGKTFIYDLRKIGLDLPESDICLILKVLDILEKKGHKLAERIILSVPAKYIIVSFSTKTLSGKPMRHPQRGWIEQMLNRLHFSYQTCKTRNEIFYLIKKS